ncbi:hypothetical protein BsWGS_01860 [Bradybaena similaris]
MGTLVINDCSSHSVLEGNNESVNGSRRDIDFEYDKLSAGSQGHPPVSECQIKPLADISIKFFSSCAEQVLLHPCIVLRRQCQVHHAGAWYHLTPVTLIQTLINILRTQGSIVLWKGLGSVFIVRGITTMSEAIFSECTSIPREVSRQIPLKKLGGHVLLKGLVIAITTPFMAASLVETVQSDIVNEKPGVLDTIFEGALRISTLGAPRIARQIPLWQLIFPTVLFRLSHYIVSSIAHFTVISSIHLEQQEAREQHGDSRREVSLYETYFPELVASFTGGVLADVLTFPMETVLHRMYVQGTRTIIDNTDTGIGVIPVNTQYEGFVDCFRAIIGEEGLPGLYRGFGALILQYSLYAFMLRLVKLMFEHLYEEYDFCQESHKACPESPLPALLFAQEVGRGEGFIKKQY